MKTQLFIAVIAIFVNLPFATLQAQYDIPSYDVELTGSNITFEEDQPPGILVAEERKLKVRTTSDQQSTNSVVQINVYKIGASSIYGTYTVNEGDSFNLNIDDDEWGVEVVDYTEGALISVWIQDE